MAKSRKGTARPILIDDETIYKPSVRDRVLFPTVDGERKGLGLVPRDYRTDPPEMFAPPSEMPLIPRGEWSDRIKAQKEGGARLSDLRTWASLDQNGQGYCWAYSTTSAVMLLRSTMNLPYVRLSAHATAWMIKGGKDEGGWCGLSAQRQSSHGTPGVAFWPEKSMNGSQYNKPATWENAATHKVSEDWVDLTASIYDRNLTFDQLAACLLSDIPCAVDFNWWGHSVCAMDLVEVEPGSFGILILNSWSDSWSDRGQGILRGSKAIPDGAVALRVTGAGPT